MKKKLLGCMLVLVFSLKIFSQSVDLTTQSVSLFQKGDSLVCKLDLVVKLQEINPKYRIRLVPVIKNGMNTASFPEINLIGRKGKKSFLRHLSFDKHSKIGINDCEKPIVVFFDDAKSELSISYIKSIPWNIWMNSSELSLRKELYNEKNILMQNVSARLSSSFMPASVVNIDETKDNHLSVTAPVEDIKKELKYRGTYCIPPSDETDKISKKEMNFSLEEARVMADVNPQILSLPELYTVALSYKNTIDQFYKIIFLSVKMYPADPIANQNAAAAAIEMNMAEKAGQFLQLAPHETTAYKNCRGVYELMIGNISDGIRLLKEAKAEGSEEANQNLNTFFKYYKR